MSKYIMIIQFKKAFMSYAAIINGRVTIIYDSKLRLIIA